MAQVFHHSANSVAKLSIVLVVVLGGVVTAGAGAFFHSDYVTRVNTVREQPVPFSHNHHNKGLGIDCRYCHTSVEKSAFAGIPPTKTCMTCHSQVWTNAALLEPVRESYRTNRPIEWERVHDLADFAYFSHDIHVNKGIGCSSCHGKIDQMQITFKSASLYMEWCLKCHRNPAANIRPKEEVFNMDWTRAEWTKQGKDPDAEAARLVKEYNIPSTQLLTSCSTCHR